MTVASALPEQGTADFKKLVARAPTSAQVDAEARAVVEQVRLGGDAAVRALTHRSIERDICGSVARVLVAETPFGFGEQHGRCGQLEDPVCALHAAHGLAQPPRGRHVLVA